MTIIEFLLRQMDDAWDTLQRSLKGLTDEEYWWEPSPNAWTLRQINGKWHYDYDIPNPRLPGPLTIAWMVFNLASCKVMYMEYAFGKAALHWEDIAVPTTKQEGLDFLEQSHPLLRSSVASLTDADLAIARLTNWGELWSTEKIVWTMIQHDVYHGAQVFATRKWHTALREITGKPVKLTDLLDYSDEAN